MAISTTQRSVQRLRIVGKNLRDILLYSDSYLFELFVGALHFFILPLAILEIGWLLDVQILGVLIGGFQLYSVGMKDMRCRYYACLFAFILAMITVVHYALVGMMAGSQLGWALVTLMAFINLYRTFNEKLHRGVSQSI
jgi:small-conductance mechanosensitive channel